MTTITLMGQDRMTATISEDDGWTQDSHYISSYPNVAGLEREGNCYWLPNPSRQHSWRNVLPTAGEVHPEYPRQDAHMILSRLEWAELSGYVQVKKIHIAPSCNYAAVVGLLLDPLCEWADCYGWQVEVNESANSAGKSSLGAARFGPEHLLSRGFTLVDVSPIDGERWRRTPSEDIRH